MRVMLSATAALTCLTTVAFTAPPSPAPMQAQVALAGTAGDWRGELQYRDYQTDTWQGLPMRVSISAQPDGVTTVRTSQYDDGPQTGIVTITTVTLIDPVTSSASYAIFRKQRPTDSGQAKIVRFEPGADAVHWTLVTSERRKDGNELAEVRETTTRNGTSMTTLKEVNPDGDGIDKWLPRNRTVLNLDGK